MFIGRKKLFLPLSFFAVGIFCFWVFDVTRFVRSIKTLQEEAIGGIESPPTDNEIIVVLTGDQKRIPKALELLRQRGAELLIISGTGRSSSLTDIINQQGDVAGNIQEIWRKIIIESNSSSTIENALETRKILVSRATKRIVLVTSDYHMPRSLHIFRRLLPQYDYISVPVASGFGEFSLPVKQVDFITLWKAWLEYWKWFLLRTGIVSLPDYRTHP